MRIYLSGPMTGLPDLNYPAFNDAARLLRGMEHEVYSPAEWEMLEGGITRPFDLRAAFVDYTHWIITEADAVVYLPGSENSPGATAEIALARAIRKPAFPMPRLGETFIAAERRVSGNVYPECDGHREQQHRDGQGPWCSRCGWTRGQPALPAAKLGTSISERERG